MTSTQLAERTEQNRTLTTLRADAYAAQVASANEHNARKHGHLVCSCGSVLHNITNERKPQ